MGDPPTEYRALRALSAWCASERARNLPGWEPYPRLRVDDDQETLLPCIVNYSVHGPGRRSLDGLAFDMPPVTVASASSWVALLESLRSNPKVRRKP